MADWTWSTVYPMELDPVPPKTLIQRFPDGTEHRRKVGTNEDTKYVHTVVADETDTAAILNFCRAKGLESSFTIQSWDPDLGKATEVTVRLLKMPKFRYSSLDLWTSKVRFIRVYGE